MILVTGGTGFLGNALCRHLATEKENYLAAGSHQADLLDKDETDFLFAVARPTVVYHLAAVVGGIGANEAEPARFWRDNLLMGINVLEACREFDVNRLVLVGTTCSYPRVPAHIPFLEEDLFAGFPEETNAPYGVAKRTLFVGADAYRKQYGLETVCVLPTNLYGPGDNFDPALSHVIPALIRKMYEAKTANDSKVTLWGSGAATRDFLYVDDAADALWQAGFAPVGPNPINVGSGKEISIAALAEEIRNIVGYAGKIEYDSSRPDGQPRRVLDVSALKRLVSWEAKTSLENGLRKTYEWFLTTRGK